MRTEGPQAEGTAATLPGDPTSMTNFDSVYDEESMLSHGVPRFLAKHGWCTRLLSKAYCLRWPSWLSRRPRPRLCDAQI